MALEESEASVRGKQLLGQGALSNGALGRDTQGCHMCARPAPRGKGQRGAGRAHHQGVGLRMARAVCQPPCPRSPLP
jgi:hypothetical protein